MRAVTAAVAVAVAFPNGPLAQMPTTRDMYNAWCASCHADDGTGRVAVPTVAVEPMDFTDCAVTTPEPDADWEIVIARGGPVAGLSSSMPAYGQALTDTQIRTLVGYIPGVLSGAQLAARKLELLAADLYREGLSRE